MSVGARCGCFALVFGLLVAGQAQAGPSGGRTWTDPPVRGAAGPPPAAAKPASETAPTKPADTAAAPETAKSEAAAQARPVRRSAKLRREQIRRVASHSRVMAEHRARHFAVREQRRASLAERRMSTRRALADRTTSPRAYRYRLASRAARTYSYDDGLPVGVTPSYGYGDGSRRAGWEGLVSDDRSRRIAQARASGYLVMRARTIEYPDGTQVRSLRPFNFGDVD